MVVLGFNVIKRDCGARGKVRAPPRALQVLLTFPCWLPTAEALPAHLKGMNLSSGPDFHSSLLCSSGLCRVAVN